MRVAIIGTGGIGGYLAAKLIAAGTEVVVVARGAHLAAIRDHGLTLTEPGGTLSVRPALAAERGDEIGAADLVIFAVKGQDLAAAIELAGPTMGPGSVALPFLNGVEAPDMLAAAFGPDRALIGIARISSGIEAPGRVAVRSDFANFVIGTLDGGQSAPAVRKIRDLFSEAGIEAPDCTDARVELWRKFIFLSSFSALTAGARKTIGEIRKFPEADALMRALVAEAAALGRTRGIALPETVEEDIVAFMHSMQGELRASLAHDLAAGKPLEVDWLSGAVARLAQENGLEAPRHETVHALLTPWRGGTEGGGKG